MGRLKMRAAWDTPPPAGLPDRHAVWWLAPPAPPPLPPAPGPAVAEPAPAPAPSEPLPLLFTPRVPWPDGAEDLWRCEITWRSGYLRSEFRVVASAPGSKRRIAVASSPSFRYLFKDPAEVPVPEFAARVHALGTTLEEQGWTGVPRGGRWYSFRYVWRRDGAPPGVGRA